ALPSWMLRDLASAFEQSRNQQLLRVCVTQHHPRPHCRRDHSRVVVSLLVGHPWVFPDFRLRLLRRFRSFPADREVWIVLGAAPGRPFAHFWSQASPASRAGNAAERKYWAVVAISGDFLAVAVGNGTRAIHQACAHHRADDL